MEDLKAPASQPGVSTVTAEMTEDLVPYTPLQLMSLTRLKDLLERQKNGSHAEPWVKKALSKAIYSVFLDCVEAGLEKEARELIGNTPAQPKA